MRRLTVAFLVLALAAGTSAQDKAAKPSAVPRSEGGGLPAAAAAAMRSIDAERMRAHVRFLSHDLLEGRGTGQRGGDLAAQYIATQFALYGLQPAGDDDGGYLQKVPLVGVTTLPDTTLAIVPEHGEAMKLKMGDDYVTTDETLSKAAEIDAQIVFAGYGIDAPEYQWNDYKDADVRGKVLLLLVNEPPSEDGKFFQGRRSPTTAAGPTSTSRRHARAPSPSSSSTRPRWPATAGTWCATPGRGNAPTCKPRLPGCIPRAGCSWRWRARRWRPPASASRT